MPSERRTCNAASNSRESENTRPNHVLIREFASRSLRAKAPEAMARSVLFFPSMYLREALRHCQDLEQRAATLYEARADAEASGEASEFWKRRAETETRHARVLSDLLRSQDEANDDGPFVIDLRGQILRLREALDEAFEIQASDNRHNRSSLYSTDFVLQCCDSLFERMMRIAELSDQESAHR